MGQIPHGSATATASGRRTIWHNRGSLRTLAKRYGYGINRKTVAKWKSRASVADRPTGPKQPRDEAIVVAFRRHTLPLLDDRLHALQPTIPHLTCSSLHRCLQRHGVSRLPSGEGSKPARSNFKAYPIGHFHIDIAEVRIAEGKLHLYVAIEDAGKFAFVQWVKKTGRTSASAFLEALIADGQGRPVRLPAALRGRAASRLHDAHVRHAPPRERRRAPPLSPSRADKKFADFISASMPAGLRPSKD